MPFTVQDDDGLTAGANAYISLDWLREYHLDRGTDLSGVPDNQLRAALIRATQYVDTRYVFIGERRSPSQSTEWPRTDAYDASGWLIRGIPEALKRAVAELAQKARTIDLMPDPVHDASGRLVASTSSSVGPISESVVYANGGRPTLPTFPAVDRLLSSAGLIMTGLTSVRA
jgi:hypothetical protein